MPSTFHKAFIRFRFSFIFHWSFRINYKLLLNFCINIFKWGNISVPIYRISIRIKQTIHKNKTYNGKNIHKNSIYSIYVTVVFTMRLNDIFDTQRHVFEPFQLNGQASNHTLWPYMLRETRWKFEWTYWNSIISDEKHFRHHQKRLRHSKTLNHRRHVVQVFSRDFETKTKLL